MNRRTFLGVFGAAAATAVVDPEALVWRPGAKKIFIPSGNNHATFEFWRNRQTSGARTSTAFDNVRAAFTSVYNQCSFGGVSPSIVIVSGETKALLEAISAEAERAASLRRWGVRL